MLMPTNTRSQQQNLLNAQYNYSVSSQKLHDSRQKILTSPAVSDQAKMRVLQDLSAEGNCNETLLALSPSAVSALGTLFITTLSFGCTIGLAGPASMVGVSTLMGLGNCWCLKSSAGDSSVSAKRRFAMSCGHCASASINACMLIINAVVLSVLATTHKC